MGESLDFWTRYSTLCLDNQVCPLKSVVKYLKGSELACPVESVRPEHWFFLLSALYNDNSLTKVHFASITNYPHQSLFEGKAKKKREKAPPVPYGRSEQNIRNICVSLAGQLRSSQYLVILKLENLPLKIADCEQLANGIRNSIVKVLGFAGCRFEEGAVEILSAGMQICSVAWMDFSSCNFSLQDIEAICNIIKAHKLRRSNEMFEKTLRYRHAVLDEMEGLNRISLNYNCLQTVGLSLIMESLSDDLWVKALDLQHCGIDDEAAEMLLKLVMTNNELEVIDVRLNLVDYGIVQRIEQQLAMNKAGKNVKYFPMPLWEPSELVRRYAAIRKGKVVKKKKTPTKAKTKLKVKLIKKVPSRSLNHFKVTSIAASVSKSGLAKDASTQTEEASQCGGVPKAMQDMFNNLRNKLTFEMKLRKFFMQKYNAYKSENEQLREMLMRAQNNDVYIDQETYTEIKQTFERLKIFFDVMKRYGLWEYLSVHGFEETTEAELYEVEGQKRLRLKKKAASPAKKPAFSCLEENENELENGGEGYCHCSKLDADKIMGTAKLMESCLGADKPKSASFFSKFMRGDVPFDQKIAVKKMFQEVINSYSGESNSGSKQMDVEGTGSGNAKIPENEDMDAAEAFCNQMFPKKFSYSTIPKNAKEIVSPTAFYKLVKRELDRYEDDSQKLGTTRQENSSQTVESASNLLSSFPETSQLLSKKLAASCKLATSLEDGALSKAKNCCSSSDLPPQQLTSKIDSNSCSSKASQNSNQFALDKSFDDALLAEAIADRKSSEASSPKGVPPKRLTARKSMMSSSKTIINSAKSLLSSDQLEKESFATTLDQLNSIMNSQKLVSNASSDEINSSDSIVTASDKMSESSISSSSSEQSLVKNSLGQNSSDPKKSYIETVSDASTYKDVESISDLEVASQASSQSEVEKERRKSNEPAPSTFSKPDSVSGTSGKSKSKSKKVGKQAQPPPPPAPAAAVSPKGASKASDKTVSNSAPTSGKGKNKQSGKNRPKGGSKSSSVPSLSDITTVPSNSLNTDSILKQISESEKSAKRAK